MDRRLGLLAGLGVIAGCVASLPPTPDQGGPPWFEISSAHFRVRTDLEPAAAEPFVATMEEMRAAMLAVWWPRREGPPGQTAVIVLRNERELRAVVGDHVLGTWLRQPPSPDTILISQRNQSEALRVFGHTLGLHLSHWFVPFQPSWYAQGMASFLESVRYDRPAQMATLSEDTYVRYHSMLRSKPVPVRELLAGADELPQHKRSRFESGSWLLVHYLVQTHPVDLAQFEQRLNRGEHPREAWRAVFGGTPDQQWDDELYKFAGSGFTRPVRVALVLPPPMLTTRPLSRPEVRDTYAFLQSDQF